MADNIIRVYPGGQSAVAGNATADATIDARIAVKSPFINDPAQDTFKLILNGESLFLTSAGSTPSGIDTTAFGVGAATQNTVTGTSAFGLRAAAQNTGIHTSALGVNAAYQNTGNQSSAFGVNAAYQNTGNQASVFGVNAAYQNVYANVSCFGHSSNATGANQVQLGDTTTTVYHSGIAARSDRRDKRNISPLDTAKWVDFFSQVAPVRHVWDKRDAYRVEQSPKDADGNITKLIPFAAVVTDGSKAGKRYHASFIAQDVRDLLESTGLSAECSAVKDASFDGGEDVLSLDKEQLFVGMTVVVQDLLKRIAALEAAK
jgi:Chaperone of endosialidase